MALLVFADGSLAWVCPAFEAPRLEQRIAACGGTIIAWDEDVYPYVPLADELRARGATRIAIEPRVRYFAVEGLSDALGGSSIVSGTELLTLLRGVKDTHELALLRRANELTLEAIAAVSRVLEPGVTDREIGALMRQAQERMGLTNTWVLPLIGEDAAYPHGSPKGRALKRGDVILVDTGGALHGYQSDNTRTWVFDGAPTQEFDRAWHTVRDAQLAGFDAMRPGVSAASIDAAARGVLAAAGYGEGYAACAHRLGHGIGMEGHEEPYLDGGNQRLLEPGMTFSDEPGIYVYGRYGLRLENIVAVTETGAECFGAWQSEPRQPD